LLRTALSSRFRAPDRLRMSDLIDSQSVREYLLGLQQQIVAACEQLDGQSFKRDVWEKPDDAALAGGGVTCMLEGGDLFERAGVGFSHVIGKTLPPSASVQRPELAGRGFEALGVSLVLHPRNPYVPTVHMNVRFLSPTRKVSLTSTGLAAAWT